MFLYYYLLQRDNASATAARESKEQLEDVVSEGEIPVGPRKSKKQEEREVFTNYHSKRLLRTIFNNKMEEYKQYLDVLRAACGVDSYVDIYSVLQKTLVKSLSLTPSLFYSLTLNYFVLIPLLNTERLSTTL